MTVSAILFVLSSLVVLVLVLAKRVKLMGDYEYYLCLLVLVLFVCSVHLDS